MVSNLSVGHGAREELGHEVLGRWPRIDKAGDSAKAEASVVGRASEHDATRGSERTQLHQPSMNQGRADTLALKLRLDGKWSKTVPVGHSVGDGNRGEGHVTNNHRFPLRDKRNLQSACLSQRLNNEPLRVAAG